MKICRECLDEVRENPLFRILEARGGTTWEIVDAEECESFCHEKEKKTGQPGGLQRDECK